VPAAEDHPDLPQNPWQRPAGRQQPSAATSSIGSGTIRPDPETSEDVLSPVAPPGAAQMPTPSSAPAPPLGPGSSPLLLPSNLGYDLLERIGKGEFGEVYRARAPGGVIVAVKRLFRPVEDALSQKELKSLERIRELRHPFLLQMHNFQTVEQRLIIVMELADGSLQDRLQECRGLGLPGIPVEELLSYFTEAAEALDFLCQEKLAHRDIKPQNLLHVKGHAKVADFGIARTQVNEIDRTMHTYGTPAYMPPEVWGGHVSVHSDQYSFAIAWYEMRTSHCPFQAKTLLEIGQQHTFEKPDVSGVPQPEQKVLLKALAKKPDERFPSCKQFVRALREACAAPKPRVQSQGFGVKAALRLLAFALIAALLAGVLWLDPPKPPPPPPPPPPKVSWMPPGWKPEQDSTNMVKDSSGQSYYQRLVREVGSYKVVMVLVPKGSPYEPETFYMMENKVWNDLYATFMADPKARELFAKYRNREGYQDFVSMRRTLPEWRKGGWAYKDNKSPNVEPFLGVEGIVGGKKKGSFPVFRVKVSEAHCFAEWLGGKLPTKMQWLHAAGMYKEHKWPGPFHDPEGHENLAVGLNDGPRPVTWGENHVSTNGCRQMAGNGFEWTRDLKGGLAIPLDKMSGTAPEVVLLGQGYTKTNPLTFKEMDTPRFMSCSASRFDIGFRVVLEK
jgi:serine/threonine protein kinase